MASHPRAALFLAYVILVTALQIGSQKYLLKPVLGYQPTLFGQGRIAIEAAYLLAIPAFFAVLLPPRPMRERVLA